MASVALHLSRHGRADTPRFTRVRAWARRWALDEQLAAGADPAATPELLHRAAVITGARERRRLAEGFERRLAATRRAPAAAVTAAVPMQRGEITASRPAIIALAAQLRCDESCRPQGVALARRLVMEGTSPMYTPSEPGELWDALEQAILALSHDGRRTG